MKNIIWQHLSLNLKGQIWLHSPCSLLHYLSSLHPWHACQKEYSNSRFNRTSIAYKQANLFGYGLCKPCKSWPKNKQLRSQFHDPQRGANSHPSKLHTVPCTFCICMRSQWAIHIQDSSQPLKGKGMMVTMVSSLPFDHVAAH